MRDILDFRPKDKQDYFHLFGWEIGQKLGYLISVSVILLCLSIFLLSGAVQLLQNTRGYPIFSYDSFFLGWYKGKVGIRAADGHIAYIGKVKNGTASGRGTLYNENGDVLYEGSFSNNKYQGKGILYNQGISKQYEGSFQEGFKDGQGKLYNDIGSLAYTGTFQKDKIVYEELAGKPTSEIAGKYTGRQNIYNLEQEMYVVLKDINCIYQADSSEDSLEAEWKTQGIYILETGFPAGEDMLTGRKQLKDYFEKPEYQGLTKCSLGEVISRNLTEGNQESTGIDFESNLKEVYDVSGYGPGKELYITTYQKGGFYYTFFQESDQEENFLFYLIETSEETSPGQEETQ